MDHPLDISHILKRNGVSLDAGREPARAEVRHVPVAPTQPEPQAKVADSVANPHMPTMRINDWHWSQLKPECRRFLASKIWKGIDFNPMLEQLEDLSLLSESWMKWAVPTYVNGLASGPIRDWLDGRNREKGFHYVLVGEHLKYMKGKRQELKSLKQGDKARESHRLAIEELDRHVAWLRNFVAQRQVLLKAV